MFGNGDLAHVNGEDVGSGHILPDLVHHIGNAVLGGSIGHPTVPGQLTVAASGLFEVEEYLAVPVQSNGCAGGHVRILFQGGNHRHGSQTGSLIAHEHKAVDSAGSGISQGEGQVIFIDDNCLAVVLCLDRQLGIRAVNGVDGSLGEIQSVGDHHVHGVGADDFFAQHQVNIRVAFAQCGEHAVGVNGTDGAVSNRPSRLLRHRNRIAHGADTGSGDPDAGTRGQITGLRAQNGMVEGRGAGRGGNHQQRGTDGVLETVRGAVDQADGFISLLLCHVSRRSTAIQIDCVDTAGLQHNLSDFLHAAAAGDRLLAAVHDHEDHLAGAGDTHRRAASAAAGMVFSVGNHQLAVLHQRSAKTGNAFHDFAFCVQRLIFCGGADDGGAVLQNAEEAVGIGFMVLYAAHD